MKFYYIAWPEYHSLVVVVANLSVGQSGEAGERVRRLLADRWAVQVVLC